jgi:hypothetical protein
MRLLVSAVLLIAPALAFAQRPVAWRVTTDSAVKDSLAVTRMPPGWHITTTTESGAILYDPALVAQGRFALSLDVFLFPGDSEEGYGILLGGTDLGTPQSSWLAFLARRDGRASIAQVENGARRVLVDWVPNDAVKPHPGGDEAQLNALRVSVEPDSIRFEANGKRITSIARASLDVDGVFGMRVGADVNLHISNLDHTVRLAPPRGSR